MTGHQVWSRDYSRLEGEDTIVVEAAKVFDSLGRVVLQVDNAGRASDIHHDSLGRTVAVADANGLQPGTAGLRTCTRHHPPQPPSPE